MAVSNTDDLTSPSLSWYAYAFPLNTLLGTNSAGNVYFPDWPKLGTWSDAYYVSMDLEDVNNSYREVGILACALDRTNILIGGTPNPPQCFREPDPLTGSMYLAHSLIPADVEGTTAPPAGRDEFLVSIENPVNDGVTTTSTSFNLWDFHVDWSNTANTTFTQSTASVASYTPGCYDAASPPQTVCVPEPSTATTSVHIDSVGDRFMPRFAYRDFGAYESFLISHTVQVGTGTSKQTGVRWYELRGAGAPELYQYGTIDPDNTLFRFMPSIAQDNSGEASVGYSISSASTHPGIRASWWNLRSTPAPTEITLYNGSADEEDSGSWGDYTSMTVDPVNGCTFWYVNEYFLTNQVVGQPLDWHTRISNFQLPACGTATLLPSSGLSFGTEVVGTTSSPQVVTLSNGQSVALSISGVSFSGADSGDFGEVNNCPPTLAAGEICTINVTFSPLAAGARTATLNVTDSAGNSPQTISLTGTGVVPVILSPTSLAFGTVALGGSSTAPPVTLTNNQIVPLTNIGVAATAPFSQTNTCGTSLAAGAKCQITVTFSPTTVGLVTGAVTISDSAVGSPQSIAAKGTGAAPVVLTPASLSFGTVALGTPSTKTITLTNHQKTTLTVSALGIVGTDSGDFSQTNNCVPSVAAAGTCTINVTFTPSAKGTRVATLTITDSAVTSPQSAKLTGTGE